MLTEEELEYYLRAGRIACEARKEAEKIVRAGSRLIDIAEKIEEKIRYLGGDPAFPVNISINFFAAHYTPIHNDVSVVPEGSIVKIDIGVHVNGYIADTATTISLSDAYTALVEASRQALEKALSLVKPGQKFSGIGETIEKVIKSFGYRPIYNLSGHKVDRFLIHAGETIPNFNDVLNLGKFRLGNAYAIEPFATNGQGFVTDSDIVTIHALRYNPKKIRKLSTEAYELYSYIYSSRKTLPFAGRWLTNRYSPDVLNRLLQELKSNGLLIEYPVLTEKSRGLVSQFEHTIVIDYRGNVINITDNC